MPGTVSTGTMFDVLLLSCHERRAMTACPPFECKAPTTKSGWPPNPE